MSDAAPVADERRIKSLDVMRGFVVLGILAVNAIYFAGPWQGGVNPGFGPLAVTPDTAWAWLAMHVFFEFKCITLFTMLFGASLYMVGGERSDKERGSVLRRRLFWLLIFGLIHAMLIWYGDILVTYALAGFLVMFARSWGVRWLLVAGVTLTLLSLFLQSILALSYDHIPAEQIAEIKGAMWRLPQEELARQIGAYQHDAISALEENVRVWMEFLAGGLPFLIARSVGVMMIGMALFKLGFLSGNAPRWVYWLMLALGAAALAIIAYQGALNIESGFSFEHMQRGGMFPNAALSIFVSLAYASLFVLIVRAGWRIITDPLAAVGRMAFTNYIAQSLIMTTIFTGGRGLGLFGEVDRPTLWLIVLAIWALQLFWSPLWLARYRMGPLEWLWRRLSYGKAIAIARAT